MKVLIMKATILMIAENKLLLRVVLVIIMFFSFSYVQAGEPMQTPEHIVKELINAMEVNDAKRIQAVFADDATQEYQRWYARKKQGDKFRSWLKSDIIDVRGRVQNPVYQVDGNQVVVKGTYVNNDNYRNAADFLLVVKDGKIVSWTMRYE